MAWRCVGMCVLTANGLLSRVCRSKSSIPRKKLGRSFVHAYEAIENYGEFLFCASRYMQVGEMLTLTVLEFKMYF